MHTCMSQLEREGAMYAGMSQMDREGTTLYTLKHEARENMDAHRLSRQKCEVVMHPDMSQIERGGSYAPRYESERKRR